MSGTLSLDARRLISVQAAAAYVGLSVHTVYTMVSQRRIPYVKVGRLTKFDLQAIDAWISQHSVKPHRLTLPRS